MKNRFQSALKRTAHRVIPPALLKYQIAWRNWRRGEVEIRYLSSLVDRNRLSVDVGAYLGAYTFFLSRLSQGVHAFEPQLACYEFLNRAYAEPVIVHRCALSNHSGTVAMNHAADNTPNQGASLVTSEKSINKPNENLALVAVERLDNFHLQNVGFIKIDAEGEETNVLAGAQQTIARDKPTLLIEIEQRHRDGDIYQVFADIEALGYVGEFILDNKIEPLSAFSVQRHQHARLAGNKQMPYINNFIFKAVAG